MPTHRARPCPIQVLGDPAWTTSPHWRAQFWLAWKTASRWSDPLRPTTAASIIPDDETPIVDWPNKTKAPLRRPFRAPRFTVVRGPRAKFPIQWTLTLRYPMPWLPTAKKSEPRPHGAQQQRWRWSGRWPRGKSPTSRPRLLKHDPRDAVVAVLSRQSGDLSTLNSFHRGIATIPERRRELVDGPPPLGGTKVGFKPPAGRARESAAQGPKGGLERAELLF